MIRRQPQLAIVIGLALVGFGAYGFSTGAKLTAPYLVIVAAGGPDNAAALATYRRAGAELDFDTVAVSWGF